MPRGSWRTTIAGLVAIGFGVLLIVIMLLRDTGFHAESMAVAGGLIAVGAGLLKARDDKVSSEESGAKR